VRLQLVYYCSSTEHILLRRKLNEMVKNINEKLDHGRLRRFAEGKKDKDDITAFAGAISDLVTDLQVRSASKLQKGR
jgi:hypothetical protein